MLWELQVLQDLLVESDMDLQGHLVTQDQQDQQDPAQVNLFQDLQDLQEVQGQMEIQALVEDQAIQDHQVPMASLELRESEDHLA